MTMYKTFKARTGSESADASMASVALLKRGRVASAVALALVTLALGACSSDDDDDMPTTDTMNPDTTDPDTMNPDTMNPDTMEPAASSAPAGSFAVVMNDGTAPGSVMFYSPDLETFTRTLATGANEGIAFGPDGTLYQNGDSDGFTGIRGFANAVGRPDSDGFAEGSDIVIGSAPGKGLSFITGSNLLASCDVTDDTADLKLFATDSTGTDAEAAMSIDLASGCWDTFYAADTDRLYVAQTDGTLAIFDEFSVEIGAEAEGVDTDLVADRTVTPVDDTGAQSSINFHGVYAEGNSVLVSDVGDAMSAEDGKLFVFTDDGSLDGDVAKASIGGPSTLLGNPVDVVLKDGAAIVAEKSNDAILVFNDVAAGAGDMMPDFMLAFTKPESVEEVPAAQ